MDLRCLLFGLCATFLFSTSCGNPPRPAAEATSATSDFHSVPPVRTSFDTTAVRELMAAWQAFDVAEQQAIAAHQAALGEYLDTMVIPVVDHARQIAGREQRLAHTPEWIREQQRRDLPARAQRTRTIERAHTSLRRATQATVIAFLDRQVRSGRLPSGDPNAMLNTLHTAGIPAIRFRKWSKPQPVEFAPIEFGLSPNVTAASTGI